MSNNYFQFKQFRVEQGNTAMKVSTDSCIQGAWTPISSDVKHVLDIGTGTGLLALMLAQRTNDVIIDAIELDEQAGLQATKNFEDSPWHDRLHCIHADVREYPFTKQYDLIIVNPPFFQNSLLGNKEQRNVARHTLSLSYDELFGVIKDNLTRDGYASVMLPYAEHQQWEALLEKNNWHIHKRLVVYPKNNAAPSRVISLCSQGSKGHDDEQLVIRATPNEYTETFTALLQPYYLYL